MATGAAVLSLTIAVCSPAPRPILAEVFYDAIGDDTGHEFVEIVNPTSSAFPLAGLRLEAGDGSSPSRWSLRWTGAAADIVPPGGRFVIGGAQVQPPPQAVASLELQNGPDAIRLVWPDQTVETLGYGLQEFPEYACGTSAADVPAGQSLARIPDASNLGSNALDFRAAAPSPGRANQPSRDLSWLAGSLTLEPEQPAASDSARIRGVVTNRGMSPVAAGEARMRAHARGELGEQSLLDVPLAHGLWPGDSAEIEATAAGLFEGKQTILCRLELAGDEDPENDADSLRVRVGPGPLEITEIQFHPAQGEGEWIEVRNRTTATVDPQAFTLSDRGIARGHPEGGEQVCEPDSFVLLAQDRDALIARHPRLDARRIWRVRPWPSLNNTDDSSGFADAIVLRDEDGTRCAREEYSAARVPNGVTLERQADGSWTPALDPDGSPLAPSRTPPPLAGRFELGPRRLRAGAETTRLAWSLPWARARLTAEIYDMDGARAGPVLPERAVAGRGEIEWRIAGLPAGIYVVALRARAESGGESLSETRLLRVDGVAP